MKILDEKGRIAGKINIIDLGVLVTLLLIILFATYKITANVDNEIVNENTNFIEFDVKCPLKNEAVAKAFKNGSTQLIAGNKEIPGTIISVSYKDGEYITHNDDGDILIKSHPLLKDIFIKIKANINPDDLILHLDAQDVYVGGTFYVKTKDAYSPSEIIKIYK